MSEVPAPRERSGVMSRELLLSLYLPSMAVSLGQGIATPVIPFYARSFGVSFEIAALVVILNGESNGMRVTGLGEFRDWLALELQILC